jgi:hypothetical protein
MKKSKKIKSLFLRTDNVIIIAIVIATYLLFVYDFFPDQKEASIFGYNYNSGYFQSIKTTAFMFFSKLVPILLLCIWFVTNKSWWYYVLLIPISVYVFQLVSVINDDLLFLDTIEFYQSLLVTIPLSLLLYATRKKLTFYIKAFDLKAQIDQQIIDAEKELFNEKK